MTRVSSNQRAYTVHVRRTTKTVRKDSHYARGGGVSAEITAVRASLVAFEL